MSAEEPAAQAAAGELVVHITPAYRVGRLLTRLVWALMFRPRHEGRDHVPASGGALLCANHQSFLDIPLVAHATGRHVCFVARESLARSRPLAWLMRRCGAVLVRRGAADRSAMREMVRHLELGDLVTIFPEGTRSPDGSLGEFRMGALLAARKAGVPIVPVGIRGTVEAWPRDLRLPRPRRVAVRFGRPVDANAEGALEDVRGQIADMIGAGRFDSVAPSP